MHSGCQVIFVGKLDDVNSIEAGIPAGVRRISFPTYNSLPQHTQWEEIMNNYTPQEEDYLPAMDDLFSIIYTSGTTGNPKGVILTFKEVAAGVYSTREHARLDYPNARFFSYLPLSIK